MIPLIIHQIWMQDNIAFEIHTELGNKIKRINDSIVPDTIKELMIDTVKLNKEFSYILWCESNISNLIK